MGARDRGGLTSRHATGTVARAARISADDVPASDRFDEHAAHALVLEVALDGGETVRAFEAWPSGGHSSNRVVGLLDAVDAGGADPRSLSGERVALAKTNESYRVDVDATRALHERERPARVETHSLAELAIAGGMLASVLAVLAALTQVDVAAVPLAATAVVVLAASLGYDAYRTRDASWTPRALPWAVGGLVPVLNVGVAAAYLARKTVVVESPEDADRVWRDVLVGVVAAFAGGLALASVGPMRGIGVTLVVHAWALAPIAVFLDAHSGRHDDPPNRAAWTGGSLVLGGAGALIYLLRTEAIA